MTEEKTLFEHRAEEAYEKLQKLREINAREEDIENAEILFNFYKALVEEEGTKLGKMLYDFAVLVDFDTVAIKPIADKDVKFWSDLESMDFFDFTIMRLQLNNSKRMLRTLKAIQVAVEKMTVERVRDYKEMMTEEKKNKSDLENTMKRLRQISR